MRGSGERRPWAFLSAAAMALLAGCISDSAKTTDAVADEQGPGSPYIPIAVGASESAVDGIVLSDSFQPLEGARLELRGEGTEGGARTGTSDRLGRFAFLGLAPGAYTLVATREDHAAAFTRVEAAAGRAASVRLILSPLATETPYFTPPLLLKGYIGCGVGFSPVNPASCTNNLGEDANHRVRFVVPVAANLTGVQFEMTWTSRGDLSGRNLQARLLEPAAAAFTAQGRSPLVVALEAENGTFTPQAQNLTFTVRVAPGTHPLQGGDWSDAGGVVVGQPFDVYLTLFYRGHPIPEGYIARPEA